MHELVRAALDPVLADVRRTTALEVRVEDSDWASHADQLTAMLYVAGGGVGVWVWRPDTEVDQCVAVADQTQDWIVESIGGTATNWPVCPEHPTTHPLAARVVADAPCWVCPVSGTVVAPIGALGQR